MSKAGGIYIRRKLRQSTVSHDIIMLLSRRQLKHLTASNCITVPYIQKSYFLGTSEVSSLTINKRNKSLQAGSEFERLRIHMDTAWPKPPVLLEVHTRKQPSLRLFSLHTFLAQCLLGTPRFYHFGSCEKT